MSRASGLELQDGTGYVRLSVKAQPRARRDGIGGVHGGALRVATTQPPEDGKANEAIRRLLARALGRPLRDVSLVRGASSRRKVFQVDGCTAAQAEAILAPRDEP